MISMRMSLHVLMMNDRDGAEEMEREESDCFVLHMLVCHPD